MPSKLSHSTITIWSEEVSDEKEASKLLSAERGGRTKVSPAARKRAAELGIDAESLKGTGIGGAVTFADVEFARSRKAAPAGKPEAATAPGRKGGFDPAETRVKRKERPHSERKDIGGC